jgi:hypothetical protein
MGVRQRMFKKKDIFLIIIIMITSVFFIITSVIKKGTSPNTVKITISGLEYASYSLYNDREVEISNGYGNNKIVINNGMVFISEADCPDKYCVKHKPISKSGESVICLPHKLVVEITGENDVVDDISE